ncbi:neprilysin-2 isoform X2 [Eurytemora carolleeae]|uniref:neprilysin-2 isoform X2 n=1 Tax=Eurytemora carolleeae TaxID=1294199 RepID=UPI000C768A82|nr:neprilysin-2 isoform X2 [Eurytemora carolleeae]|eukprot:XP_023343223.1 neprilysin-2-like isoform X2 [Eurytemora affinis]
MSSLLFLMLASSLADGLKRNVETEMKPKNETALQKTPGICLTPGCVKAASTVIEMIDKEVDPCTDFFEFACGNFHKKTIIPDHQTHTGTFTMLGDKLNEQLRILFESTPEPNEPKIFKSVRNYYNSCMDQDRIEKSGKKTLLKLVDKLGGWPVLEGDKWEKKKFSWHEFDVRAHRMGLVVGSILMFKVDTDYDNSSLRIFEIDQPEFGLDKEYLQNGFKDKDVQAYYRYMVNIAVHYGAKRKTAKKELKESLLFEILLATLSIPKEQRRNSTALNNKMPVKEANKMYPGFDWTKHINNVYRELETPLKSKELINVAVPSYVKELAKYLPRVRARVQANYLVWRALMSLMLFNDKTAQNIELEYCKLLTGKKVIPPRWETCTKVTAGLEAIGSTTLYKWDGSLTNAVGAMYAKKYFPESSKKIADDMVTNIRKEFKILLDELDWMDDITRKKAQVKVDKMTPHIGYAKEILDNNLINEFYKGLEMSSDSFLVNHLTHMNFIKKYYAKQFRNIIDPRSWEEHGGAAIVNAFYDSQENSIKFPAGILDGVYFQDDRPKYMNYGAIGMVVGHEITHGFDDQGSQKDGDGNLVNWWEPETKKKYLKRAQCIIDQYGNYTVNVGGKVMNLNGINTQGENVADNGGFKEAYRFRVNGSLRNLKEFSRDWNCPSRSPMNPVKKCKVW